jgi:DNA polymerase-3 subunit epsilon
VGVASTSWAYTVLDTETTGMNPSAGDAIVAIGAVHVVNGRVLERETFDRLVDPRRAVSPASTAVHGISGDMLAGQPTIDEVLPELAAFAAGTVLVGHNVDFDLRFLEVAQKHDGGWMDQPALDTLLLSAALHPDASEHRLDAVAQRLGVPVLGRHTALGDALVTAEVFLRLLRLLAARGVHTLDEARELTARTKHARTSSGGYTRDTSRGAPDATDLPALYGGSLRGPLVASPSCSAA